MTLLFNAPERFAAEMLEGFIDANRDRVRAVPGGVVRATASPPGKVAVVIGGGSGHYPAFIGFVGHGLADGAAAGDVFASPSARQIITVARAADHGGGVLLAFGNYAGDVLNFTKAATELRALGIDARVMPVTDDIASAAAGQEDKRRGIAGDLVVFKVAGAAAEAGLRLDDVERIARKANDRTRSLGVAFSGCTLPGARDPLFAVAPSTMAVGMGVHGEPGIRSQAMTSADGLAAVLVDEILAARPESGGNQVAAILNGLGATKYEELFVLWRGISRLLTDAGITVVAAEVGELVTSLDMTGCSMTLCWLDDELAHFWTAPADSPAYQRGRVPSPQAAPQPTLHDDAETTIGVASADSRRCARTVLAGFEAMAAILHTNEELLGKLDAAAGDGDHGRGMTRGCTAAVDAARRIVERGGGARTTVLAAAAAWADRAGGTSGALWGEGLVAFGSELDDQETPDPHDVARAAAAALTRIQAVGGAEPGDKTLVDALHPFVMHLGDAIRGGEELKPAWMSGARAATAAAETTTDLVARLGRARPLAALSKGTPDPGAVSMAMCLQAIGSLL